MFHFSELHYEVAFRVPNKCSGFATLFSLVTMEQIGLRSWRPHNHSSNTMLLADQKPHHLSKFINAEPFLNLSHWLPNIHFHRGRIRNGLFWSLCHPPAQCFCQSCTLKGEIFHNHFHWACGNDGSEAVAYRLQLGRLRAPLNALSLLQVFSWESWNAISTVPSMMINILSLLVHVSPIQL